MARALLLALTIAVALGGASPARAQAPDMATPTPPSTGREMPTAPRPAGLTPDQQRAAIAAALAHYQRPQRNCALVTTQLISVLWGGERPLLPSKETRDAYAALAVCAAATNRWAITLRATNGLLGIEPSTPHAHLRPQAEIALGLYAQAGAHLQELLRQRPRDVRVIATAAHGACRVEKWDACGAAALDAQSLVGALTEQPERDALAQQLHLLRAEALFHTAKLDESTKELEAALALTGGRGDITLDKKIKRNEIVKLSRLAVEPTFDRAIPLGVYHLLGRVKGTRPLVTLALYNFADAARQVRIEVEIPGVTEKVVTTKLLLKNRREVEEIVPPLREGFALAAVRADRPAQLSIKITSGAETLYEKMYPVTLLPRDSLPLSQRIDADVALPTPGFIAAWVTPNARAVDGFLSSAKARVGGTFAGMQRATFPQVKAIWDELKAQGVSYVMDPTVLSDFGHTQRTRLPTEVLASKNAQCLEGTILFATLLEAIGLRPILVHVPGHAFVGWRPNDKDGARPDSLAFVETTMVHNAEFEDAMRVALARVGEERRRGSFERGIFGPAFMLDLDELRRAGFRPQPVE